MEDQSLNHSTIVGIILWGGIGDAMLATPSFKAMKKSSKDVQIRVMCLPHHYSVLQNNPYLDYLSVYPNDSALKEANIDKIYITYYGFIRPSLYCKTHATKIIAQLLGLELDDITPEIFLTEAEDAKGQEIMGKYERSIFLHISSNASKNQQWPIKKWEELVLMLKDFTILQLRLPHEPRLKGVIDVAGIPIREAIAMIKYSKCFVGIDSCFPHAIYSFQVPAVILFGPSSPVIWGYPRNKNIYKHEKCSPCIDTLLDKKCPHGIKCMKNISVEEVYQAIITKINKEKR